ncbi:MAG TPA: hypothetical protein VFK82_10325 [Burkholderiaceae bacterium]|nr:hypothetical protein [Burkholderiaceae bacterium]
MTAVLPQPLHVGARRLPAARPASSITQRLLVAVFAVAVIALALAGPIPQPADYHAFADTRTLLGLPYAMDVLSNLPFVLVGLWMLWAAAQWMRQAQPGAPALALAGLGCALTGLGSAYYHLEPDHWGLLWDRLPIGLTAVGLLAVLLAEHVDARWGRGTRLALLAIGALLSSVYWYLSIAWGAQDLRPYLLAQFSPMLALAVLAAGMRGGVLHRGVWGLAAGCYALAKVCELLDAQIFALSDELLSGHTLKHLWAALALAVLAHAASRRVSASASASAA